MGSGALCEHRCCPTGSLGLCLLPLQQRAGPLQQFDMEGLSKTQVLQEIEAGHPISNQSSSMLRWDSAVQRVNVKTNGGLN